MKTFLLATVLVLIGCGGVTEPANPDGTCQFNAFEYAHPGSSKFIDVWWDPYPQGGAARFVVEAVYQQTPYAYYNNYPYSGYYNRISGVLGEWHPNGRYDNTNVSCVDAAPDLIDNYPNDFWVPAYPIPEPVIGANNVLHFHANKLPPTGTVGTHDNPATQAWLFVSTDGETWIDSQQPCYNCFAKSSPLTSSK